MQKIFFIRQNAPQNKNFANNALRINFVASCGALCFLLSSLELIVPKPLPFLRIGFANMPLVFGVYFFCFKEYCLLTILKILGQLLISGTLFSYLALFSVASSLASALAMFLCYKILRAKISALGISVVGAFFSNVAQLCIAKMFFLGGAILSIVGVFLLFGTITSAVLGALCLQVLARSRFVKAFFAQNVDGVQSAQMVQNANGLCGANGALRGTDCVCQNLQGAKLAGGAKWRTGVKSFVLCVLLLLAFFANNLYASAFVFVASAVLFATSGKKFYCLPFILITLCLLISYLIVPCGKVLFTTYLFGKKFAITQDALFTALQKCATLHSTLFLSKWFFAKMSFANIFQAQDNKCQKKCVILQTLAKAYAIYGTAIELARSTFAKSAKTAKNAPSKKFFAKKSAMQNVFCTALVNFVDSVLFANVALDQDIN